MRAHWGRRSVGLAGGYGQNEAEPPLSFAIAVLMCASFEKSWSENVEAGRLPVRAAAPETTTSCYEGHPREAPTPETGLPRKAPRRWDRIATQRSACKEDATSARTANNQESAAPDAETRRFRKLYPSSAVRWRLRNGHVNHGGGAKHGRIICRLHQ